MALRHTANQTQRPTLLHNPRTTNKENTTKLLRRRHLQSRKDTRNQRTRNLTSNQTADIRKNHNAPNTSGSRNPQAPIPLQLHSLKKGGGSHSESTGEPQPNPWLRTASPVPKGRLGFHK